MFLWLFGNYSLLQGVQDRSAFFQSFHINVIVDHHLSVRGIKAIGLKNPKIIQSNISILPGDIGNGREVICLMSHNN